jgi:hypothetical protein
MTEATRPLTTSEALNLTADLKFVRCPFGYRVMRDGKSVGVVWKSDSSGRWYAKDRHGNVLPANYKTRRIAAHWLVALGRPT